MRCKNDNRHAEHKGYCLLCWYYWNKWHNRTPLKFLKQVHKTDRCWNWVGAKTPGGYGLFLSNGVVVMAHRASYEHYIAPIPYDWQIDHLCRNPSCVRPEHLEAVTAAENRRRVGLEPAV